MKNTYAYCLTSKKGNVAVLSGQLPIYWNKKVAKQQAEIFELSVTKIMVVPVIS